MEIQNMKFEVGELVITPAASALIDSHGQTLDDLLARHQAGDWGDVSSQLRLVNEQGLAEQFNLQSTYEMPCGQRIAVVTNRDRSITMIHLDSQHSAGT
jgi:hypothetical protein